MEDQEISYIAVAKKSWGCDYGYYNCHELDLNKAIHFKGVTLEEVTKYLFQWCLKNEHYDLTVNDFKIYHVVDKDRPCSDTLELLEDYERYKDTKQDIESDKEDTVARVRSAKRRLQDTITKIALFDKEVGTLKQLQERHQKLLNDKEELERQIPILEQEAQEAAKKEYVHLTYEEYVEKYRK